MMITTTDQLENLVHQLLNEDAVALDTEFHGEKRYWPDLFLVQLSGSSGPVAVDPLKIEDLSPLVPLMESESTVKVIHSARNDIEILMHHLGTGFSSVFDTQLAAAFLGFDRQPSLSRLIKDECGANPKKGHTLSDWSMRPLGKEQLEYALDDVRYLLDIYRNQVEKLERSGRLGWYQQEACSLTDPSSYGNSLQRQFKKIRSRSKVRKNRLSILWALVNWRDSAARSVNKPRNFIARDHLLGAMAAMVPKNITSLSRLRGISESFISSWGEQVLDVIKRAFRGPADNYPDIPSSHSKPGVSARKDILRIFLKQESSRLGISPQLLLSKDLMKALSKDPPRTEEELYSIPELSGWRKEALGRELVCLLNGKLALRLDPDENRGLDFIRLEK